MASLQNPLERHITVVSQYTQLLLMNHNITNPPNTIHKELYNFIEQANAPSNIQPMTYKFPYLPKKLLT